MALSDPGEKVNEKEGNSATSWAGEDRALVVTAHWNHLESFQKPRRPGPHTPLQSLDLNLWVRPDSKSSREWFRSTVSVTQHCAGEGGRLCALGWLMYFEKGHSHQLHVMRTAVLVSGGPQAHSTEQSGNQLAGEAITALILALWLCSLPPTDQTCQKPVCLTDNVLQR